MAFHLAITVQTFIRASSVGLHCPPSQRHQAVKVSALGVALGVDLAKLPSRFPFRQTSRELPMDTPYSYLGSDD